MIHWQQLGESDEHEPFFSWCVFLFCFGLNTNYSDYFVSLNVISILISLYCVCTFFYIFLFFFLFLFVSLFIYLFICIYLAETNTFTEMRMIPTLHHREFPCVQGNTLTVILGFLHHQRFLCQHWTFVLNKEFGYLNILK